MFRTLPQNLAAHPISLKQVPSRLPGRPSAGVYCVLLGWCGGSAVGFRRDVPAGSRICVAGRRDGLCAFSARHLSGLENRSIWHGTHYRHLSSFSWARRLLGASKGLLQRDRTCVAAQLSTVPEPVQKWLRRSGVVGRPFMSVGRLAQEVEMNMKPEKEKWISATAVQYTSVARQDQRRARPSGTRQVPRWQGPDAHEVSLDLYRRVSQESEGS